MFFLLYFTISISIPKKIYAGLIGNELYPVPLFILTIPTVQQVFNKWQDDLVNNFVIHTMLALKCFYVRGKMAFKFLAAVDDSILITKESPAPLTIFIINTIIKVSLHFPKLFYNVFGYCEVRPAVLRRLEILERTRFKNVCQF